MVRASTFIAGRLEAFFPSSTRVDGRLTQDNQQTTFFSRTLLNLRLAETPPGALRVLHAMFASLGEKTNDVHPSGTTIRLRPSSIKRVPPPRLTRRAADDTFGRDAMDLKATHGHMHNMSTPPFPQTRKLHNQRQHKHNLPPAPPTSLERQSW